MKICILKKKMISNINIGILENVGIKDKGVFLFDNISLLRDYQKNMVVI